MNSMTLLLLIKLNLVELNLKTIVVALTEVHIQPFCFLGSMCQKALTPALSRVCVCAQACVSA